MSSIYTKEERTLIVELLDAHLSALGRQQAENIKEQGRIQSLMRKVTAEAEPEADPVVRVRPKGGWPRDFRFSKYATFDHFQRGLVVRMDPSEVPDENQDMVRRPWGMDYEFTNTYRLEGALLGGMYSNGGSCLATSDNLEALQAWVKSQC